MSEEERVDVGESLEVAFKILRHLLTRIDHLLNKRVDCECHGEGCPKYIYKLISYIIYTFVRNKKIMMKVMTLEIK